MTTNGHDPFDEELTAAARTLQHEWDSPELWPSIASQMREESRALTIRPRSLRWAGLAAAAALVLAASAASWLAWRAAPPQPPAASLDASSDRLLTDEALAEVERSEAQYTRAIEELSRLAAPKLAMPEAPLLLSLRDRLMTIDEAIDEARMQIDVNPFNAQLRRQLLFIYQEKRRTLEQVQEYENNAL